MTERTGWDNTTIPGTSHIASRVHQKDSLGNDNSRTYSAQAMDYPHTCCEK